MLGRDHPDTLRTRNSIAALTVAAGEQRDGSGASSDLGQMPEPDRVRGKESESVPSIDVEIRAVLRPLMSDRNSRRARLTLAFGAYPGLFRPEIVLDETTAVFLDLLMHTFRNYGEVEPGLPAVRVLLESIKSEVGVGDRAPGSTGFSTVSNRSAGTASANPRTPQREMVAKEDVGRNPMTHGVRSTPSPSKRSTSTFSYSRPLKKTMTSRPPLLLGPIVGYHHPSMTFRIYYESDLACDLP